MSKPHVPEMPSTEQQLDRERDRSRLLLDINNAVVSRLSLRELLSAVSSSLREILPHDFAAVVLCEPDGQRVRVYGLEFQAKSPSDAIGELIERAGTPFDLAMTSRQTVLRHRIDLSEFPSEAVRRAVAEGLVSGCSVPLISHDRVLGSLDVASFREAAFTEEDARVLTQIGAQIAIAVENVLHYERAQAMELEASRERDRTQLLLEINNAVVSQLGLAELLSAVSACLRRLMPHDFAGIALCEPDGLNLRVYGLSFPANQNLFAIGQLIPMAGNPSGIAITSRSTLLCACASLEQFPSEAVKHAMDAGLRSVCSVPLISHDQVLGSLDVASCREGAFTPEDAELLSQIGLQIAIGVENALNYERAQAAEREAARDRDRLQLLLDINNAVVSCLNLQDLLTAISSSLRRVVGHDFAGLTLYHAEENQLRLHAQDFPGLSGLVEGGVLIPIEGTPPGRALRSRQTVVVRRIDFTEFPAEVVKQVAAAGVKSGCCVPLLFHERPLGTLELVSLREDAFTDEDARLLTQIGSQIAIAVSNALAMRDLEILKEKLTDEKIYLEEEIQTEYDFEQIIGSSAALKQILKQVETVAPIDSTVLIRGETGTGKELIARAIHHLSARRERTLVKLNCAAIPTGLLESELFGHEKGAFTGAIAQRIGRFELAHRGTLFLDEVGDIPLELQPKLLRVLQEQEFERLGSARTQRVDVRMVAATNCDLECMVAEKTFRSDLYYRLNVFPISIPPLRERPEDIPLLVRFFAQKFASRMRKPIRTIPAEANAALTGYHWPGNVRELENFIERAVILSQGTALQIPLAQLKPAERERRSADVALPQPSDSSRLESIEREHILRVLRETRWVVAGPKGAAARLGMKRTTLQARMRKLGITRQA